VDWRKSFLSVFIEPTGCGTNSPRLKRSLELMDVSSVADIMLNLLEVEAMRKAEVIQVVEAEEAMQLPLELHPTNNHNKLIGHLFNLIDQLHLMVVFREEFRQVKMAVDHVLVELDTLDLLELPVPMVSPETMETEVKTGNQVAMLNQVKHQVLETFASIVHQDLPDHLEDQVQKVQMDNLARLDRAQTLDTAMHRHLAHQDHQDPLEAMEIPDLPVSLVLRVKLPMLPAVKDLQAQLDPRDNQVHLGQVEIPDLHLSALQAHQETKDLPDHLETMEIPVEEDKMAVQEALEVATTVHLHVPLPDTSFTQIYIGYLSLQFLQQIYGHRFSKYLFLCKQTEP